MIKNGVVLGVNTTPFLIVDFWLIWRGEIVHFIVSQFLKGIHG